jgi:LysM repeat protein
MNILRILGIVVAVHLVAFFLMFVNPGCRSTSHGSAPIVSDTAPTAAPAVAPAGPGPAAPDYSGTAVIRYSPTRPNTPAAAALESAPPPDVTPAKSYTVLSGDNLSKIAKKQGTTIADLKRINHLTESSVLTVGQKLLIPGKAPAGSAAAAGSDLGSAVTYTIRSGDTLASVAHRAGTTTAELRKVNDLKSDYVRVGQELKLPSGATPPPTPVVAAPVKKADGSVVHVVRSGETLGAIAHKYQVKTKDLLVANNIANPQLIRAGQELVIPGYTGGAAATVSAPATQAGTGPAPAPSTVPSVHAPVVGPTVTPAAGAPATPAPTPGTTTPATDQDLDAGLKPQDNVPVIKVDDTGAPKSP